MVISAGEKLHVMYRINFEKSVRRHFVGTVIAAKDALCRIEGYVFVYDERTTEFLRKPEKRTSIIDISDSGMIVNVIAENTNIDEVRYKYSQGVGLVATDGKDFSLNINEFGSRS